MEVLVREYASQLDVPVSLHYTKTRGYHLKIGMRQGSTLPSMFVQRHETRRSIFCSTHDLTALDIRQKQAMEEIVRLTVLQLAPIRNEISNREMLRAIFRMGEAIALTDYILGLASFISRSPKTYTRPTFSTNDFNLHSARHPVMELLDSSRKASRRQKKIQVDSYPIVAHSPMKNAFRSSWVQTAWQDCILENSRPECHNGPNWLLHQRVRVRRYRSFTKYSLA